MKWSQKGMTLIELVIGLGLLVLLIFGASQMFNLTTQGMNKFETKKNVEEEMRGVLDQLKKEAGFATSVSVAEENTPSASSSYQVFRDLELSIQSYDPTPGAAPIGKIKRYQTRCVPAPGGAPALPSPQDCISCANGEVPILVDTQGNTDPSDDVRLFPSRDRFVSNQAFSATLCTTQNPALPVFSLNLVAYAQDKTGKTVSFALEAAIAKPAAASSDIQLLRKF